MSTSAQPAVGNTAFVRATHACRMLVLYEDTASHERAMEAAYRLAAQFEDEVAFAVTSCAFRDLPNSPAGTKASEAAALADVLMVATHGHLNSVVDEWLQGRLARRKGREGALVLMLIEPIDAGAPILSLMARCNHAAATAKMDFLPMLPHSAEEMLARISQSAALYRPPMQEMPPSHWGLNE